MKTFPIMLKLTGRCAAVVGAGCVGLRKAQALAAAGAQVRLIDPSPTRTEPALPGGVELIRRKYDPSLLDGAVLVFACTDDERLNARIAADAKTAGIPVNVADQPDQCDFFSPAVVRDGDVIVAIGTGGLAPALARAIKEKLADALPAGMGTFAAVLGELRAEARRRIDEPQRRASLMSRLASPEVFEIFRTQGADGVRKLAEKWMHEQ